MLYAAMNIPVLISVRSFTDNRYSYLGVLICNSFAECFVNSRFEIRKHLSNDIENASVRSFRNPANLNLFLPSLSLCKAKFPQDKPISFGSALENQLLQPYISLAAQNLDVHFNFLRRLNETSTTNCQIFLYVGMNTQWRKSSKHPSLLLPIIHFIYEPALFVEKRTTWRCPAHKYKAREKSGEKYCWFSFTYYLPWTMFLELVFWLQYTPVVSQWRLRKLPQECLEWSLVVRDTPRGNRRCWVLFSFRYVLTFPPNAAVFFHKYLVLHFPELFGNEI